MPLSSAAAHSVSLGAVDAEATDDGGAIVVRNKTCESIVDMAADEYGNGRVGAWNRKGDGRVYDSQ